MRRVGRSILVLMGILVLGMPLTFVITILLLPLWSEIERRCGIESVGHSGPAEWCFWVVFSLCIIMLAAGTRWLRGPSEMVRDRGGEKTS